MHKILIKTTMTLIFFDLNVTILNEIHPAFVELSTKLILFL